MTCFQRTPILALKSNGGWVAGILIWIFCGKIPPEWNQRRLPSDQRLHKKSAGLNLYQDLCKIWRGELVGWVRKTQHRYITVLLVIELRFKGCKESNISWADFWIFGVSLVLYCLTPKTADVCSPVMLFSSPVDLLPTGSLKVEE